MSTQTMGSTELDPALSGSAAKTWRDYFGVQSAGVFYALALMVVGFTISTNLVGTSGYLSLGNFTAVLQQTSIIGVLAVFTTIVFITGNFDLSIASVAALSSVIAIRLGGTMPMGTIVLICLVAGGLCGLLNAFLVVVCKVNGFVATLGTQMMIRGGVYLAAGQISVLGDVDSLTTMTNTRITVNLRWVFLALGLVLAYVGARRLLAWSRQDREQRTPPWSGSITAAVAVVLLLAGVVSTPQDLTVFSSVYIMLAIGVVTWLFMRYTVAGRRLYACGSNAQAARLSGIRVARYQAGALVMNGVAAGFAGLMIAGQFRAVDPTVYTGQEFVVITGAVLGGTALWGGSGDVLKSIVGAVIMLGLTNALNFQNIDSSWQYVVQGAVLITAAAIYTLGGDQKNGGRRRTRKRK